MQPSPGYFIPWTLVDLGLVRRPSTLPTSTTKIPKVGFWRGSYTWVGEQYSRGFHGPDSTHNALVGSEFVPDSNDCSQNYIENFGFSSSIIVSQKKLFVLAVDFHLLHSRAPEINHTDSIFGGFS